MWDQEWEIFQCHEVQSSKKEHLTIFCKGPEPEIVLVERFTDFVLRQAVYSILLLDDFTLIMNENFLMHFSDETMDWSDRKYRCDKFYHIFVSFFADEASKSSILNHTVQYGNVRSSCTHNFRVSFQWDGEEWHANDYSMLTALNHHLNDLSDCFIAVMPFHEIGSDRNLAAL